MSDHEMTDDSGSESAGSVVDNEILVETLVSGREKRSTAGNRLDKLLTQEADDDELELLFAEQGEDDEFEADATENQSDVQLDSSSDEEDGGDAGADDELAGERELERQARAARTAAKRKAEKGLIPLPRKKKVQIDPEEARRLKRKRVERSWAPAILEGAVRQSSRTLSVQNKELVHARLEEGEKRRQMTLSLMDAAAKKREHNKTKPMTQEEHLAEAARVEKRNSKALNRWEEAEKARQAERDAKLAALHDRQMDGPFIRYWSGPAEWINGRLGIVGRKALQAMNELDDPVLEAPTEGPVEVEDKAVVILGGVETEQKPVENTAAETAETPAGNSEPQVEQQTAEEPITDSMAPSTAPSAAPESPLELHTPADKELESPKPVGEPFVLIEINGNSASVDRASIEVQPKTEPVEVGTVDNELSLPPKEIIRELSAKNLVLLENFNSQLVKERDVQRQILFHRRTSKPSKPSKELCVITSRPARYRDPSTGLPYHDRYAFKQIQRLREGKIRWSDLLGCYVGSDEVHAQGVPDRFYFRG